MSDQNTAAIQALIQQMTTIGERLDGLAKHNERLLDQVMATKKAAPAEKPTAMPTADDYAKLLKKLEDGMRPTGLENVRRDGDPVTISRTDALDARKYTAAKAKAAELGVPLEMIDDRPSAQAERPAAYQTRKVDTSMIDTIDDTAQKLRYVRHDVATGGAGLIQNSLSAERDGYRMVTFKDESDLPDHVQTKLSLMASAAQASGGDADE